MCVSLVAGGQDRTPCPGRGRCHLAVELTQEPGGNKLGDFCILDKQHCDGGRECLTFDLNVPYLSAG